MVVRAVVLLSMLLSGLLVPPAASAPVPAQPAAAVAPALGPAAMSATALVKPRAVVAGSYVVLASGKLRVSLTSTSTRVKLTWRTSKNKKRSAVVKVRKGAAVKTLPKGSKRIVAQAKATKKLRTGVKTPISAYVPPPTPPGVDSAAPVPVSGLAITDATASSISLRWVLPGDADLAQVIVRRAAGDAAPASADAGLPVALTGAVAVSVTDTGLAPDTAYSYAVFTRDQVGNTSTGVTVAGRTSRALDGNAPPVPEGVTVVGADKALIVSWSAVAAADLAGYRVYSSTSPDGPWTPINTTPNPATTRQVTGIDNGTQYWVRVTSVDTTGNESAPSLSASGVPAADPLPASVTALISPTAPTVVQAGGFRVTIPPGTVTDEGVAVTVTPLPWEDGLLPSVDVHIHGKWDPAAGGVAVTLPWPFGEQLSPVVLHHAADGLRVTSGRFASLAGAAGERTVTVTATSLTRWDSAAVECDEIDPAQAAFVVGCGDNEDLEPWRAWERVAEREWLKAQALQLADTPCTGTSGDAAVVGAVLTGKVTCQISNDGSTAKYQFTNTSDEDVLLWQSPAVLRPQITGGTADATIDNAGVPLLFNPFSGPRGTEFVFPGATLTYSKGSAPRETDVSWKIDRNGTMAVVFTQFLAAQVGGKLFDEGVYNAAAAAKITECSSDQVTSDQLSCVRDVVVDLGVDLLIGAAGVTAKGILSQLDMMMAMNAFAEAFSDETATTHLIHSTPTNPPTDRGGSRWIARNPDNGRAVLVDGSTVRPILDGGAFLCLAQSLVVWDIPTLEALRTATPDPATCLTAPVQTWDVRPAPHGNVGTDVILRNPAGNAWLINTGGEIQTIPDNGTYLCLAATNPVIWNVPDDAVNAWTPVGTTPASCGSGGGGGSGPVEVTRVSVSTDGAEANAKMFGSFGPSVSADGRFVAFTSDASDLVPGDTNNTYDVFVHDRQTGETSRVSVGADGIPARSGSGSLSMSADGRFVAFTLWTADRYSWDVLVHDRQTGVTSRVAVGFDGAPATGPTWGGSFGPSMSADGRFVAFTSDATNLVPGDTNGTFDAFVHDRQTGETSRVSIGPGGAQVGSEGAYTSDASISADGRFVAFHSDASNLVPGDTNNCDDLGTPVNCSDVFVHDRQTGETSRVSVGAGDTQANGDSVSPSVSADGRFVAFYSRASNLVPGDTNGTDDVFVHDRQTGVTSRVSIGPGGAEANNYSYGPSVSADGRFVAFYSDASNLVPEDNWGIVDVFVHDRQTGVTSRVSVGNDDNPADGYSAMPSLSADGQFVAFQSSASNLVAGDTNTGDDVFVARMR